MSRNFGHARREIAPDQQLERNDRYRWRAGGALQVTIAIAGYVVVLVLVGVFVL